jgi:hypothetical protein
MHALSASAKPPCCSCQAGASTVRRVILGRHCQMARFAALYVGFARLTGRAGTSSGLWDGAYQSMKVRGSHGREAVSHT